MTSPRKQRARVNRIRRVMRRLRLDCELEDQLWDRMPAVGREFGSPGFERLMEEDYRLKRGVFDLAVPKVLDLTEVSSCRVTGMKRVRVAPGKFVTISPELAEKAARVIGTGLTRDQVLEFKASEPRLIPGPMAGSRSCWRVPCRR